MRLESSKFPIVSGDDKNLYFSMKVVCERKKERKVI